MSLLKSFAPRSKRWRSVQGRSKVFLVTIVRPHAGVTVEPAGGGRVDTGHAYIQSVRWMRLPSSTYEADDLNVIYGVAPLRSV